MRRQRLPLWIKMLPLYILVLSFWAVHEFSHSVTADPRLPSVANSYAPHPEIVSTLVPAYQTGTPKELIISRLGISLPIVRQSLNANSKSWLLTEHAVNFISEGAALNNYAGKAFLYGHDSNAVLASTSMLKQGDQAYITTDEGNTFVYSFQSSYVVPPTDIMEIYDNSSYPGIKLMICTGFLYSHRRIMLFKLEAIQ